MRKTLLLCLFFGAVTWAEPSERWQEYLRDSWTSPGAYFAALGPALGQQMGNEPEEWGQGMKGYSRRAGARFAQVQLENAMTHGTAAILSHRVSYEKCECAGGWSRTRHAMSRVFVTRNKNGGLSPNFAVIGGTYGSAMIATTWYPDRYSPWRDGARSGTVQLGVSAGFNVLREFAPELKRFFLRR